MSLIDIDWTNRETTTGDSKSITGNPAYPLGGSGNYQCSNTVDADTVRVVRCKECKHRAGHMDGYTECDRTERIRIWHPDDWFCADGKRKNDA